MRKLSQTEKSMWAGPTQKKRAQKNWADTVSVHLKDRNSVSARITMYKFLYKKIVDTLSHA